MRKLYHYINGKKAGVYSVDPSVSIEQVFEKTMTWPGVRLILITGVSINVFKRPKSKAASRII